MPKRKIRFMGLLTNTDSSILGVKLEHGYKIEKICGRELIDLITKLENIPEILARTRVVEKSYLHLKDDKVYVISNSIDGFEVSKTGELNNKNFVALQKYDHKYAEYLYEKLTLMRLYKEGHLFMPDRYYFLEDDETPVMIIKIGIGGDFIRGTTYSLEKSELQDLQTFFQSIKLPFKISCLKIAHQNYDTAYLIYHRHLSFLALMMSMESLFNPPGEGELTYRISRNTAVLIGKDKDDSRNIWIKMKELYSKRCDIVHRGKSSAVTKDDIKNLRDYVIRSIKEFYKIGKNKKPILEMLNSCGFGDRPWLQNKPPE